MKNMKGITLIALVITVIVLIILAGVAINLSIGKNSIIKMPEESRLKENESSAREKLEILLANARIEKEINTNYNNNEFLTNLLEKDDVIVDVDNVTVDGYIFSIDREKLIVLESIGQAEVKISTEIKEYLGKNENGKYIVNALLLIESNSSLKSIIIENPDGTVFEIKTTKNQLAKNMQIELNEEYTLKVLTQVGNEHIKKIKIDNIAKINNIETHAGASYIDITLDVETIPGVSLKYNYKVGDKESGEIITNSYTQRDLEEKTKYNIEVIVTDETGYFNETIKTEATTQEKIYLYKYGEEYKELTGGWVKAFSTYSGTGTKKEDNLYCYASKQSGVYSTFYFITTNKVELNEYRYLYCNSTITNHSNGNGGHFLKVGLWDKKEYEYHTGHIIREPKMKVFVRFGSTAINKKLIVDISETTEERYITAGITSGGANDSISANVYEVWLEK